MPPGRKTSSRHQTKNLGPKDRGLDHPETGLETAPTKEVRRQPVPALHDLLIKEVRVTNILILIIFTDRHPHYHLRRQHQ